MASSTNQNDDSKTAGADVDEKKKSSIKFLFSRQGRPTLIIVMVAILMASLILWWFGGLLLGPGESERDKAVDAVASEGSGDVDARQGDDVKGDLTSDGLTDEAKEAANLYNAESINNESMHPAPTFDDVEIIDIPEPEPENEQPTGLKPSPESENKYTYTPPATESPKPKESKEKQARYRLSREQIANRREQRLKAARQVKKVFQNPPKIASVAFDTNTTGTPAIGDRRQGNQARGYRESHSETVMTPTSPQSQTFQCPTEPLVRGGEIVYANNDIALNTDHKGPVRITFLQGNLNGWIGMGSFGLNELGAKMNVTVDRLISPSGQSFASKGYVLDPETTLWAVSSDVDHHLIYRYGGFGLASILGGFADLATARATKSQTSTVNGSNTEYREPDSKQITWRLLGDFGEVWQKVFADNLNRPITVTVDPNERFGVLFSDTVCGPRKKASGLDALRHAGKSDPVEG